MKTALRDAISLLIGLVIFIGLPLVGWGVMDARGFIGHPARLGYVVLAIVLQVILVIKMPGVGSTRSTGTRTVQRQKLAIVLLQVISLAVVIAAPYCDRRAISVIGGMEPVRYVGLALFTIGFLVMHWAQAALARQFSVEVTIQEDHKLVTDGPYRYLRHPRYLGIIVFSAGFSLVFRSWLALILVAAIITVLIWRIRDEEKLMHQEFGEEWEAYSRRSWRLIPYVY